MVPGGCKDAAAFGTGAMVAAVYCAVETCPGCGVCKGGVARGRVSGRFSVGVEWPLVYGVAKAPGVLACCEKVGEGAVVGGVEVAAGLAA